MTTTALQLTVPLEDEAATIRLGEDLALILKPGDCLALSGDLGAGKSTIARAFLRALADDAQLEVPSPTFTLVQTYELRIAVAHFDLYRLGDPDELDELGFDEALGTGICLVEWPEMAQGHLPEDRIRLLLEHDGNGRVATITATEEQLAKIRRNRLIRQFLTDHDLKDAARRHLSGDASARAYETITSAEGEEYVLMDWQRQPDGPAVLDGKPYPKVAHISEDVYPFIALSGHLLSAGFSAPKVLQANCEHGILLLENLGSDGILDAEGRPIVERYRQSVACLAHLHSLPPPVDIEATPTHIHHVPIFDPVAMKIETRLLVDWYLPWKRGAAASEEERESYFAVWDTLIAELKDAENNLLLRDFHSPNILWQSDRQGIRRVGLIDFQDAMIGPTAYDLASIVQDARVTIEPDLAALLMSNYLTARNRLAGFNEQTFLKTWSIMAAQRNCKLAGLWVRLMQRDGKAGYMQHMPRTLRYLQSALQHDALTPLRDWCEAVGINADEL